MKTTSIVALVAIVALFLGLALGEYFPLKTGLPSQSTEQSSTTFHLADTMATAFTVGAQSFGVLLHLVNTSGRSLQGVRVNSFAVGFCNNQRQIQNNPENITDATGWADLRYGFYGNYYVSFTYNLWNYNITVPVQPTSISVATYDPNSGNLTIRTCCSA